MPKKKENAFYLVAKYTSYGVRVYLSNMGYTAGNQMMYIWETGFNNARKFLDKKEAVNVADAATQIVAPGALPDQYMILKYLVKEHGGFELSVAN